MTITEFRTQHPELFKNAVDSIAWEDITDSFDDGEEWEYIFVALTDHFQSYIYKYTDKWPK